MLVVGIIGDGGYVVHWRGWHAWVSLVIDDVLFVLELMSLLMVGVRLAGAFRSVFVRRWRIYCMMLVSGFRGLLI